MKGTAGSNGSAAAHVVVLGGGFGGLETAFYLRMLATEHARITLVSDRRTFLFKPNSVYVPFGLNPKRLRVRLAKPAKRKAIELVQARAHGVDPDARRVAVDGRSIPYDFLVIATGAGVRAAEVPGLAEHAIGIWSPVDMLHLRAGFHELVETANRGERRRIVFVVPPNNKCAIPLYEIALMLDTWLRRKGAREGVRIEWTTFEQAYLQDFGPRLHEVAAAEFERRGIVGHPDWVVENVDAEGVGYANGERLNYDLLIALPPHVASTPFAGLPADERGFLRTDLGSRRLHGHPEIFVVGDAGDFPVKQTFLAFLQADAAAAHLSAEILGEQPRLCFDPVSVCLMEQFDKATFAQVPLRLTGDPANPIEVRPNADGDYRVGSSRLWRAGKRTLGLSVPWRFSRGEPFHGGNFWRGMDAGLKAMSGVLAE